MVSGQGFEGEHVAHFSPVCLCLLLPSAGGRSRCEPCARQANHDGARPVPEVRDRDEQPAQAAAPPHPGSKEGTHVFPPLGAPPLGPLPSDPNAYAPARPLPSLPSRWLPESEPPAPTNGHTHLKRRTAALPHASCRAQPSPSRFHSNPNRNQRSFCPNPKPEWRIGSRLANSDVRCRRTRCWQLNPPADPLSPQSFLPL